MVNNYFDKIYVINLDRRPDRLEQFNSEAIKFNINYERYSAVDSKLIDNKTSLKPGELGCLLSHLDILNKIVENNYKRTLIFEDDTIILENFKNFGNYINQLPNKWDMIYLGGNQMKPTIKITENVHKVTKCFTTSYYGITLEMAKKMIPEIEKMDRQVDVIYARNHLIYNCYVFEPKLCIQRPGYSDVLEKEVNYKKELGFE